MARTMIDGQKMLGGEGSILVGKLGRAMSGFAVGDEAVAGAMHHLSETTSVNISHSLSVAVKWTASKGCSLELDLSKTAGVEKSVGDIALVSNKSKVNIDQSHGIMAQLESLKNRVSGVSIDEETANLVKFQQTYDASAKVLKVADEMFDTVLSIKR